jgi:peroxiredoxin Q/BCP
VNLQNACCTALAVVISIGCHRAPESTPASAAASTERVTHAAPPLDTSWERDPGRLLAVGETAPNFEGIAHTGMRVRLSSFLGKPVVVYFYAEDKSPADTTLARGFRDEWLKFNEKVGMVLGVSANDRISHKDFATEEELPFLLIADESHAIAKAFGVPSENGAEKRTTFIIGKDGKISKVFPEVSPDGHVAEVLATLD